MVATIKTSVSIPSTLFNQAEILAQHLNISQSQLFEMAIENFIRNNRNQTLLDEINKPYQDQPDAKTASQIAQGQLVINQGDIYWVQLEDISGSKAGIPHPHVVIQDNVFNHSRIHSVVACALTTNIKRASTPGNVLLEVGEANLPKQSVVETSKVSTLDKTQLGEYIGSVTERRINQILAGLRFLQLSFFHPII